LVYTYTFSVRGYELDSYNHVNNAVYLNYFEQARWEIIRQKGLLDQLRAAKFFLVITESRIRYVREARLFDELTISTELKLRPPYLIFEHKMHNQLGQKISVCSVKTLLIDENKIPHDFPSLLLND
jgi:YbgC/YbaW family acyl-CoA thioester hydrolase